MAFYHWNNGGESSTTVAYAKSSPAPPVPRRSTCCTVLKTSRASAGNSSPSLPQRGPPSPVAHDCLLWCLRSAGSNGRQRSNPQTIDGNPEPLSRYCNLCPRSAGFAWLRALLAIPLFYSVYLGIAEAARDIALERARSRRDGQDISSLVGEIENESRHSPICPS